MLFKEMLDSYKLSGQDYLYGYIDLIKALLTQNTDDVLTACKRACSRNYQTKKLLIFISLPS